MGHGTLLLFVVCFSVAAVNGNFEGDVLASWKTMLNYPNNVLQSWDPTLVNPCTWFCVSCNSDNSVVRLDLGNCGLSGNLSSGLGTVWLIFSTCKCLIPSEFGNLTRLVSLDLYNNQLSGSIPSSLGNLKSLRYL